MKPSILALLPLLISATALAQSGGGVKGGDAVVCFEPPVLLNAENQVVPYVEGQTLTEAGRQHAVSASTREHYQIDRLGKKSAFWNSLQGAPYDRALEAMISRFDAYPLFAKKLREINSMLGPFHESVGFTGLYDVADSGVDWPPVKGCAIVQAVTRDQDLFRFDVTVNKLFDNTVKSASMQMHEITYYYLSDLLQNASNSSSVELLLISALGLDPSTERLGEKFTQYGFLRTPTTPELEETIRNHAAAVIAQFEDTDAAVASRAQADCPPVGTSDPGWSNFVQSTLPPASPLLGQLPPLLPPPNFGPLPNADGSVPPADPVVMPVRLIADDLAKWISAEITNPHPFQGFGFGSFPAAPGQPSTGPLPTPAFVYPKTLLPRTVYRAAQQLDKVVRTVSKENGYKSTEAPLANMASMPKCTFTGSPLTVEQKLRIDNAARALVETTR